MLHVASYTKVKAESFLKSHYNRMLSNKNIQIRPITLAFGKSLQTLIRCTRPFAGRPWWSVTAGWNDKTSITVNTNMIMFIHFRHYVMYALERVINNWPRDQTQGSLYAEPVDLVETGERLKGTEPGINTYLILDPIMLSSHNSPMLLAYLEPLSFLIQGKPNQEGKKTSMCVRLCVCLCAKFFFFSTS